MQASRYLPGRSPARNLISDFRRRAKRLGIELTEVLRPACSNHGISPVEEESFHREIIKTAQKQYYAVPNATPVRVSAYFTNARGNRRSKHELARALSEFVQRNVDRANPIASFAYRDAPHGFDSVVIAAESAPGDWWSGEVGGITLGDIRAQVEMRIAAKDSLVGTYRSNLPRDAGLWLLLLFRGYSRAEYADPARDRRMARSVSV